jgi:hypothetical protein
MGDPVAEPIKDAISARAEREYLYAEQRAAYNAERANWPLAERWALYARCLWYTINEVCWDHQEDRADA